ncbi:hypothetical protein AAFC00_007290 [Neodothiora populina]|uniref:Major facilitator superfamily (MFS) profile domain-containing protein n=1 Tax=Neodothiora populina TaxID=2781224 RepID=A0ABR3PHU6_9PEZI
MSQNGRLPDETAPLLAASQPSTVDETLPVPDDAAEQVNDRGISVVRGVLCVVGLASLIFLQATNISILTTTQSTIAADLDAFEKTSWFTSSYLIAMSSFSPITGKLAQIFGPRIMLFVSTILLAIGVLVAAFAQAFPAFIVGRVITGLGAAGIFTVSIIVVLELSGPKRRGVMIGLLNSGYTVGVAMGATAAGALLPKVGWRALFWMQAPVSLTGGALLLFAIPHGFTTSKNAGDGEGSVWRRLAKLDYFGAASLTLTLTLLLYALSSPRRIPILPILLSLLTLVLFVICETRYASDPLIPISLLRSRGLLLTCLGTTGFMLSRWLVLFYSPTYALAIRSWQPAAAGSILIATNAGFAFGGIVVGAAHIRRHGSFYIPSLIAYGLFPITLLVLAQLSTSDSNVILYIFVLFANGATTGAALNYTLAHLLHLTPSSTHYVGTALLATFRGFAGSFGSAIGGGVFSRVLRSSLEQGFKEEGLKHREALVRRLLGSPALVSGLKGIEHAVAVSAYEDALWWLWIMGAGVAALMVLVQAGTGWVGHKETAVEDVEEEAGEDTREGPA